MPVTELAVLTLFPTALSSSSDSTTDPKSTPLSPAFIALLRAAKALQNRLSGHSTYYYQQLESPNVVYVIGVWESVAAHGSHIGGKENQELLEKFKEYIDWDPSKSFLFHIEMEDGAFAPSSSGPPELVGIPFNAPVLSINRHFVKNAEPGDKAKFSEVYRKVKPLLEEYTAPQPVAGGFRIEKEKNEEGKEKEEWVLFSGFESPEKHWGFAQTEEFQKYKEIVEWVDGFEVKHGRRVDV